MLYLFWFLLLSRYRAAVSSGQGRFTELAELWQRSTLHISQHAILIELWANESGVAVKLHQLKDLWVERERKKDGIKVSYLDYI